MAQNTYTQKAQAKELSDIVDNIAPYKTPFQSMIGKDKITNVLFNWAEEELGAVKSGGAVEGADAPDATDQTLAERSNYSQIFTRAITLSGSSQFNKQAGNVQTLAHSLEMRSRELKRDVENAYVGTGQVAAAGSTNAGRVTAGYQAQIDPSVIVDKAGEAFVEDDLTDILVDLYENGAEVDVVMAAPKLRASITKVLQANGNRSVDQGKSDRINATVGVYISDHGTVEIHSNNFCRAADGKGDVLVMDTSKWAESVFRPYKVEELAKTGDADKRQLIVEKGLKNKNFKASGIITGVKF